MTVLKTRGPQTSAELGCATGVCGEAARQQLNRLASEGLVVSTSEPRGVGRPVQVWRLTAAANSYFPDGHADLAAQLLRLAHTEFGKEAVDRLIDLRAAESKCAYQKAMEGATDLADRVQRLADARTREGYMAEVLPIPEGNGYLLVENHCPICVVATGCQSFCRTELETFREVIGPEATVERTEHIVKGHRRCAYRVIPVPAHVTRPV